MSSLPIPVYDAAQRNIDAHELSVNFRHASTKYFWKIIREASARAESVERLEKALLALAKEGR